ncbi:hypothetical protein [Micromonospora sp. NBC_01796]|uniref:hypothetical protein n=1 Tax=Micromonospora sp. NBC_01796 TaxID=2975987 RepID=UPI002DD92725|nr:hypothetical protein [Micromonospora sp. NBC_01796]WSA84221.1 hypothetical protein OIE47_28245 [Micromonospora sp. NBC_01796]
MRVARVLVPIAIASTLLAGCGGQADSGSQAAPAAAATTVPDGNGVAALTADEIRTKAVAAAEKAGSFQVKGESESDGDTLAVDLTFNGEDLVGSIGTGGSTIHLLRVAGQPYFKANAQFWTENGGPQGPAIAPLLGDRWVKIKPDDPTLGEVFKTARISELIKPDGAVTKGEIKTIDAGPAIALIDGSDQILYVATTGEPYPLLLGSAGSTSQVVFSGYGSTFEIKAPAASEVIDFDKITAGG